MTAQDSVTFDPAREAVADVYKFLIGAVVPRPIAFVSSVSAEGVRNLAPFSFFTVASVDPPVVCFVPLIRSAGVPSKDTLRNVRETGEFVLNIVSEDFAAQMNLASGEYPPEVDEFAVAGLTPVASDLVSPCRVGEARVQMECRVTQIVEVSSKPLGGNVVFGEVLRFHASDDVVKNFRVDPAKLKAIGRMGGPSYVRTGDRFNLERPK